MRWIVVAGFVCVASAAAAQGGWLSAPEARRIFFGIDMSGRYEPSQEPWRECIAPDGKTAYWFGGAFDEGRLTVRRDGALCFSYASSSYKDEACWRVKRTAKAAYRFESTDGTPGVFVTTATRPAQSCPGRAPPVS
jgi:hypothetical protein